jgi:hypothetical protein
MSRRICVTCLASLAQPGSVRCIDCESARQGSTALSTHRRELKPGADLTTVLQQRLADLDLGRDDDE